MYKVVANGKTYYSETKVDIYYNDNGCYTQADSNHPSTGICLKIPVEHTINNEDGTTAVVSLLEDTVFRITENGLTGTEPLVSDIEVIAAKTIVDDTIATILGDLETV